MNKKLKIKKLDARYRGYPLWKYFVEPSHYTTALEMAVMFYEWREWCWEIWGPSKELNEFDHNDLFNGVHCSNNHWCWTNDHIYGKRIYLKGDGEASVFTLRWYG